MQDQDIEIIFLDIDGVLADFDAHIAHHNVKRPNGKFDYAKMDFNWWATIPVFDGAAAFYEECAKITDTKFLTGPMVSVDCFQGKAHWIAHKFLHQKGKWALTDLIIMHSKKKQLLAAPNRILVDDILENVERWRKAGGIGIHHTGDFAATMRAIKHYTGQQQKPQPSKKPIRPPQP